MSRHKKFVVWSGLNSTETWYYTDNHVTLMTTQFSEAKIFESRFDFWKVTRRLNNRVGRFTVHGASAADIMKWKLQNKVPSDRL